MKTVLFLVVLALSTGTLKAQGISIPGNLAELKCEIDERTGEVTMAIDLSDYVQRQELIISYWAKTTISTENCEEQKQELLSRKSIEGNLSINRGGHCVCHSVHECALLSYEAMTFSPLKQDGTQYFDLVATGSRETPVDRCPEN